VGWFLKTIVERSAKGLHISSSFDKKWGKKEERKGWNNRGVPLARKRAILMKKAGF